MRAFAENLILEHALPVLSAGYANLVKELKKNHELQELAVDIGVHKLIDSDHPVMQRLKKQNKEFATEFEKQAEWAMREAVLARFPDHMIVGEEHGVREGDSEHRWVFDPVDGTSAMIRTAMAQAFAIQLEEPAPAFGVTVAYVKGKHPEIGVVAELRAEGLDGLVVSRIFNGEQTTRPESPDLLATATLACTNPATMFADKVAWGGFQALQDATKHTITDLNCVGFMELLTGQTHIVYEADLAYHDAAALLPPLEAAGLKVTDEQGNALRFAAEDIRKEYRIVATHPALHNQVIKAIIAGVPDAKNHFHQGQGAALGYAKKFV